MIRLDNNSVFLLHFSSFFFPLNLYGSMIKTIIEIVYIIMYIFLEITKIFG